MNISQQIVAQNSTASDLPLSITAHYVFLGIDIILITPLLYFHFLKRAMLMRENKKKGQNFMKNLLEGYVWTIPISFVIVALYINVLTAFIEPPAMWIGSWFCTIFELFGHIDVFYIGGFSFWAALIKYWFIVHNKKATKFGEEKAGKILFIAHIVVPLFFSSLNSISNGRRDQVFWVDHCWGESKHPNGSAEDSEHNSFEKLLCLDRNYTLPIYFDESIADIITQTLRVTCGGLKIFYLIFLSNMVEFFLYFLIFRYLNRLHAAGEQRFASGTSNVFAKKRQRRHKVRKTLLVLDYAIELGGGFFMFFAVFVGDSIFYQRVLFCAGTFLYGVPIPMAYLLNESRVRNIIVNDGWLEGIKSIFLSDKQIRDNDRLKTGTSRLKLTNEKKEDDEQNGGILNGTSQERNLNEHLNSQLRENENIISEIAIGINRSKRNSIEA